MKYMKVKTLMKQLEKIDPETEIFFHAELPRPLKKIAPYITVYLKKPVLHDYQEDIDNSKYIWCTFGMEIDGE